MKFDYFSNKVVLISPKAEVGLRVLFSLALVAAVFRWILLIIQAFNNPLTPVGDEIHFLMYLDFINNSSVMEILSTPIALNYSLLVYPLTFVLDSLIALRFINIALFGLFAWYLWHLNLPHKKYILLAFVFYAGKVGIFNVGINDPLFVISFSFILIESFCLFKNGKFSYPGLYLMFLVISFTTRPLIIIYFPVFFFSLAYLIKCKAHIEFNRFHFVFPLLLILLHSPCIISNGSPNWDHKTADGDLTWAQRQYLAQIQANQGLRIEGTHPSWHEVGEYIRVNGEHSLPKTFGESIYFNWELTFREFFKDFMISLEGLLRQTGGVALLFVFCLFNKSIWRSRLMVFTFIPLLYALCVFSFIIISNVEWRWFAPVVILFIVSVGFIYENINSKTKLMFDYMISGSVLFLSSIGVFNLLT